MILNLNVINILIEWFWFTQLVSDSTIANYKGLMFSSNQILNLIFILIVQTRKKKNGRP